MYPIFLEGKICLNSADLLAVAVPLGGLGPNLGDGGKLPGPSPADKRCVGYLLPLPTSPEAYPTKITQFFFQVAKIEES